MAPKWGNFPTSDQHALVRDRTFDAAGMKERMDAIRLKQILGAPLTERELMCLQIEQNGLGCHARLKRGTSASSNPAQRG